MAAATIEQHYMKQRIRLLRFIVDECDEEIELGNDTGEDGDPAFGEMKETGEALIKAGDTLLTELLTAGTSRDTDRQRLGFDILFSELVAQVRDAQRVGYFDLFGE